MYVKILLLTFLVAHALRLPRTDGVYENTGQCNICEEDFVAGQVVALECGHMLCAFCEAKMKDCPFCRRPIKNKIFVKHDMWSRAEKVSTKKEESEVNASPLENEEESDFFDAIFESLEERIDDAPNSYSPEDVLDFPQDKSEHLPTPEPNKPDCQVPSSQGDHYESDVSTKPRKRKPKKKEAIDEDKLLNECLQSKLAKESVLDKLERYIHDRGPTIDLRNPYTFVFFLFFLLTTMSCLLSTFHYSNLPSQHDPTKQYLTTAQKNDFHVRLVCLASAMWEHGASYQSIARDFGVDQGAGLSDRISVLVRHGIDSVTVQNIFHKASKRMGPSFHGLNYQYLRDSKIQPKHLLTCFIDQILMKIFNTHKMWMEIQPPDWHARLTDEKYIYGGLKELIPWETLKHAYDMYDAAMTNTKLNLQRRLISTKLEQDHETMKTSPLTQDQILAIKLHIFQMMVPCLFARLWRHNISFFEIQRSLNDHAEKLGYDSVLKLNVDDLQTIYESLMNSTEAGFDRFSFKSNYFTLKYSFFCAIEMSLMEYAALPFSKWESERTKIWNKGLDGYNHVAEIGRKYDAEDGFYEKLREHIGFFKKGHALQNLLISKGLHFANFYDSQVLKGVDDRHRGDAFLRTPQGQMHATKISKRMRNLSVMMGDFIKSQKKNE